MLVVLKRCKLQLNHATSDLIEVYQTKTHIAKNELLWLGNVAVLKTFHLCGLHFQKETPITPDFILKFKCSLNDSTGLSAKLRFRLGIMHVLN